MMDEETLAICNQPDCTFSQTGICVLNNEPVSCPDRISSLGDISSAEENNSGDIYLEAPVDFERFSSSFSLAVQDAQKLMRNRYCKVVAILGVPGTGKTACLASLYLLLAHGRLNGFQFLDSKSIRAFEEITGGTRRWNSVNLPEQLTVHTEMQDERIAGYLHLRLKHKSDGKKMDLLLTDLPGEWTLTLMDRNRTDRLGFLKSAERIWITINSEHIMDVATRRYTIHRADLLLDRIKEFLEYDVPGICIVLTHCDKSESVREYFSELINTHNDLEVKIIEIASFSQNPDIPAGFGLEETVKDLLHMRRKSTFDFTASSVSDDSVRNILKFQNF
jgi:hypothetical protein